MQYLDIFKISRGTRIKGLATNQKNDYVEVNRVESRVLRADCQKFGISFRDTNGLLWYISESSPAEIIENEEKKAQ